MAAAQLSWTCSFRASRALRRIPLSSLHFRLPPRFLISSFHSLRLTHRSCLPPPPFVPLSRLYCALNLPSGSPEQHRNLSQEEIELDEEISRLERRHRDSVAKLASSKAREQSVPGLDRRAPDVSSGSRDLSRKVLGEEGEETRGFERQYGESGAASRMGRRDKDQLSEPTSLETEGLLGTLRRGAGSTKKFSSPEVRQLVSVDEEDEGVANSILENDFSSDDDIASDTESEADARGPNSIKSSGTSQPSHPWDEWNAFMDVLHEKNYFKEAPKSASEGEGHLRFQNASYTKHAITEFARERDDIIRFLTKKHIRIVVNIGCPSTDRKVVNAAKRLRVFCLIPEDEVCQQCKLKTFCTRAFAEPAPKIDAGTIDVVRVLHSFALNASPDAESQVAYPIGVVKSVCHLLNEIVQLSAYPRDPGLPKAKSLSSANLPVVKKATESQNSDRRPGDWTCPDCNFLNFSKNRECRECGTFKENAEQHLEPGDWECPECTFINFRRNKECRECLTPRPKQEQAGVETMEPGDWKCAECQFVNFRKNSECRRCSARRIKTTELVDIEELEPGDWRCPKCNFRNFRRNKECRECNTLRPADTEWNSAVASNDHRWGLKKAVTKSEEGWGSRQSLSSRNTGSSGNRMKFQEWKPDLKKAMNDDTDDDLEEDADIVFSKDESDTSLKSRGSSSQRNSSTEDSDNEFDFSDMEDKPPRRVSPKKVTVKKHSVSQNFDGDDISDSEDDFSDDGQTISNPTKPSKGRKQSFVKWDDMSEDEDEVSDDEERYGGKNEQKRRLNRKDKVLANGKMMNDEGRKTRFSGRDKPIGRHKQEKKLEMRGRSRTSSDDESHKSNRSKSMRSPRLSLYSSDDDRPVRKGSTRGSRTSGFSSEDDRFLSKGSMGASSRDNERYRGAKRTEEDIYSKTSIGGRSKAKMRGRQ